MKPEKVTIGEHDAGAFTIVVSRCVNDETPEEAIRYFSVLLHEHRPNDPLMYNVNLVQDERFAWFAWMQTFERPINDEDIVEFNDYVWSVFGKIGMPTFKLSRRSVVRLAERCESLSKKSKKFKAEAK